VSRTTCPTCDGSGYACAEIDDDGRAVDCPRCAGSGHDPFLDFLRSLVTPIEKTQRENASCKPKLG
jgi:DnaJ-class molecular chaperone